MNFFSGINLNPFDSSLFTGKGLPWGPGDHKEGSIPFNLNPFDSALYTGKGTPWGPGDAKGDLVPIDNLILGILPKQREEGGPQPVQEENQEEKMRELEKKLNEQRNAERAKEAEDFTLRFLGDLGRTGLRDSLMGLQEAQRRARGRSMFGQYFGNANWPK